MGREHAMTSTDDELWSCVLETPVTLLTNVGPISLIKNSKDTRRAALQQINHISVLELQFHRLQCGNLS